MLPDDIIDEAERLTRLAREADARLAHTNDEAVTRGSPFEDGYTGQTEADRYRARRDELLAEHGYVARVRSEDTAEVLVCHPTSWLDDEGTVVVERVDPEEAVEIQLSGTGDSDEWKTVEAHNRAVAEAVSERHGEVHGFNAHRLADFAGNHYAKPIEDLTPAEREEFLTEYYPRNGWPNDKQRALVAESVELARELALDD
ncbi:rnhA operon protein [Halosegnis sp.]|uniref:DUF7108 family protein n=1 Tax=Halosegnis sp. TaxID=2864959 RepID=UPI0035D48F6B